MKFNIEPFNDREYIPGFIYNLFFSHQYATVNLLRICLGRSNSSIIATA